MAIGSYRKKKHHKQQQQNPSSPLARLRIPSMASSLGFRKISWLFPLFLTLCFFLLFAVSPGPWAGFLGRVNAVELHTIEVVNVFPHDAKAFTQGLVYVENNTLYESTGLYGQSSVRKVALRSGKVKIIHKMNSSYFGEGLTLFGERLFQVTWMTNEGFIYEPNSLGKIGKFTHQMTDGWGLATDRKVLFGSDGTSTLYVLDPQTFKVTQKQTVKYEGHEVHNLNELEYVNDEVWANIYTSDCIARISNKNAAVKGWILLNKLREGLKSSGYTDIDVLNGIAWDRKKDRIFVTGKLWPKMFEIKLHPLTKPFNGDIKKTCMRKPIFTKS